MMARKSSTGRRTGQVLRCKRLWKTVYEVKVLVDNTARIVKGYSYHELRVGLPVILVGDRVDS